jgi:hypothetical protein
MEHLASGCTIHQSDLTGSLLHRNRAVTHTGNATAPAMVATNYGVPTGGQERTWNRLAPC